MDAFELETCVGRIMAPLRLKYPNPENCALCFFTWQDGVKEADGNEVANQLTLK